MEKHSICRKLRIGPKTWQAFKNRDARARNGGVFLESQLPGTLRQEEYKPRTWAGLGNINSAHF